MDMSFRPTSAVPIFNPANVSFCTFREAAESYLQNGGDGKYLPILIREIGDAPLSAIHPFDVKQLAKSLYPTQKTATLNRYVITPIRAVMYHAFERGWGPPPRLRNYKQDAPRRKKPASQAWLHAFLRQADRDGLHHVGSLVMFMSQTAARVSEAIRVEWPDIDLTARTALLRRTKTGTNSLRYMTDQLVARIYKLREGADPDLPVFRITHRSSVNERIAAICERAGISYKPSHTCGRHAFANNSMQLGNDIKTTMVAGGWRSSAVFLEVYCNPQNAGRIVAERFNTYQYDSDL